jgi:hypothetical protein
MHRLKNGLPDVHQSDQSLHLTANRAVVLQSFVPILSAAGEIDRSPLASLGENNTMEWMPFGRRSLPH